MPMAGKNVNELDDGSESEDNEEMRTLFCANLDERVTEDLLYEVFLQAGPIDSARIPKDHGGRQRTFGFITYVHKSTAPYAMQLYQGLTLFRKTVTIKYQGSTQPSPIRSYASQGISSNMRSSYDNSSLRSANYSSHDNLSNNPFRNSFSPDYSINSNKHQHNILKHASSHERPHNNASPYLRKSGGNEERDRERDHNRGRHYNNGSNRHSDQRPSKKNRR